MSDNDVLGLLEPKNLVDVRGQARLALRRGQQIAVPQRPCLVGDDAAGVLRGVVQRLVNGAVDLFPRGGGEFPEGCRRA